MTRPRSLALVSLLSFVLVTASALAQESGGSFGGSDWGSAEPSGGGSSAPSYDPPSYPSTPTPDYAQQRADDQARREAEAAAAAAAAAAEAEREREEAERIAADRARKLALPPADRVGELDWPPSPPYAPIHSPVQPLDAPLSTSAASDPAWHPPSEPMAPTEGATVTGEPEYLGSFCCAAPFALLLVIAALLLTRMPSRKPPPPEPSGPLRGLAGPAMRVSIAFDWSARAALQAELAAMAKRFDMRSRTGLGQAARAMAQLLTTHEGAVRYATWELSQGDARTWFQTRANDLRARYRAELVRNESTAGSPEFVARESEGEGLVVVTVVVATSRPIPPPPASFTLAGVHAAIAAIAGSAGSETMALEVIWSPAAENDRMSSYELEKIYPELQRLTAGVGARQCTYCRGPFPAELKRCPNCGAPS